MFNRLVQGPIENKQSMDLEGLRIALLMATSSMLCLWKPRYQVQLRSNGSMIDDAGTDWTDEWSNIAVGTRCVHSCSSGARHAYVSFSIYYNQS